MSESQPAQIARIVALMALAVAVGLAGGLLLAWWFGS
jgi:hypothetical protein